MKALVAAIFAAGLTSAASAGFIIEDPPEQGSSWTQQIILSGSFDMIAFELVSDGGAGPFGAPGITDFIDPSAGGTPIPGWGVGYGSPSLLIVTGADSSSMEFTLHFDGDRNQAVTFRGVAFQDGEFQFSADFVWNGVGFGFDDLIDVRNINGWQPEAGTMMTYLIPLPAPIWLGSLGLLAVIALRRRLK